MSTLPRYNERHYSSIHAEAYYEVPGCVGILDSFHSEYNLNPYLRLCGINYEGLFHSSRRLTAIIFLVPLFA